MQVINKNRSMMTSFTALYKVKAEENPDKVNDIVDLKTRYSRTRNGVTAYTEMPENNGSYSNSTTNFVGDNFAADDEIETMLANKGIKFERMSFGKLLCSPESVKERVVLSPEEKKRGFKLVEVDRTKFDEQYEYHGFAYVGNKWTGISQPERMEKFENYLKTGKKIHAPVVFINDEGKYPEIAFEDGRHRYAYMRDIKMKGIPVAMNEDSVKVAEKFGLLAQ